MAAAPSFAPFPDPITEVARQEVRALLVRHLADLPAPASLCAALDGPPGVLVMSTSRAVVCALRAEQTGAAVLSPHEYELLALALADGTLDRVGARALLERKASRDMRLTPRAVLGHVMRPAATGLRWTFGDLLDALGARLVAAQVEVLS